MQFNLLYT